MEEFLDFAEQHKGEIIFNAADGDEILSMLMKNNCEIFVNFETGECNFDSEEFVHLLEICAAHPADKFAEIAYSNTKFKNGNVLLSQRLITEFGTGQDKISFGEDFTYKGYPGNGSGSYAYPAMSLAITANAKYPEGAWEFVKSSFTKEYQDYHAEHYPYYFPVRISSLDISMEPAKQDYYIDEDGEKIENSRETVLDDGTTVTVPKNTDDDNEK